MLNLIFTIPIFLLAFFITSSRGMGRAFTHIYLPAMMLMTPFKALPQPVVMEISPYSAALYGIVLALPLSKERFNFRFGSLDAIMLAISMLVMFSSAMTGEIYTGIGQIFEQGFDRVLPFFLARFAFTKLEHRTSATKVLVICTLIATSISLIDFRLRPEFYRRTLQQLGFAVVVEPAAFRRFGFFRSYGTVEHPISWGNCGLMMVPLIIVAAKSSGISLRNRWTILAIIGGFFSMFSAISFTPLIGLAAGLAFFFAIYYIPQGRHLIFPGIIAATIAITMFTYRVAQEPPARMETSSELEASYEIRKLIIRVAWREAWHTPIWGRGKLFQWDDENTLESVDNAYLLGCIWYGPIYTVLLIGIAYVVGFRAFRALGRVRTRSGYFTLAVGTAGALSIPVAMFTVWAGGEYGKFWVVLLGLVNCLYDQAIASRPMFAMSQPNPKSGSMVLLRA